MGFVWLVIIVPITAWRITVLITQDRIAEPFRRMFEQYDSATESYYFTDDLLPYLVHCFSCVSFWVGVFCYIIYSVQPELLLPFFFSGMALLVDTYHG